MGEVERAPDRATVLDRDFRMPFGGAKQSGIGREGSLDVHSSDTRPKSVNLRLRRS